MPHWLPSLIQRAQKSLMFLLSLPLWFGLFPVTTGKELWSGVCHVRYVLWLHERLRRYTFPHLSLVIFYPSFWNFLPVILSQIFCGFHFTEIPSQALIFFINVDVDTTGLFSPSVFSHQRSQTVRYFLYHSYLMDKTAYLLTITVISGFR